MDTKETWSTPSWSGQNAKIIMNVDVTPKVSLYSNSPSRCLISVCPKPASQIFMHFSANLHSLSLPDPLCISRHHSDSVSVSKTVDLSFFSSDQIGPVRSLNFMENGSSPRTVEEIFKDFSSRRAGIVRALTTDVNDFYGLCDPEKENLCLYGHSNETWEVTLPAEEVPPELPEPALGINFARDGMNRKDWLSLVAVHSDSWLLSVAFYFGARLNRNDRKRLFTMMNDLPTLFEIVTERKAAKDKPTADSGSKSRVVTKRTIDGQVKSTPKLMDDSYEEDEDEHSDTLCGSCGGNYNADEFWIGCDICERWYHGKCVKITPAKAESIKQYKCPSCLKKNRQ